MNRRHFLSLKLNSPLPQPHSDEESDQDRSEYPRVLSGLETYNGPWDSQAVRHILTRTHFGTSPDLVETYRAQPIDALLAEIFDPKQLPDPPVDPSNGESFITGTYDPLKNGQYIAMTKVWWFHLMLNPSVAFRERMTLFWQNHYVIETDVVRDARTVYYYLDLLRKGAFGNYKSLARDITKNAAMLEYLNGNQNIVGRPNENYARELLELFTIGKGKEVSPGNYTTYTESDVREAARVLTGWTINRLTREVSFRAQSHDTGDKVFSSAFQGTVIKGRTGANAGDEELDELLTMIFRQEATALFLARKLYRWFVFAEIDDTTESNVIAPLAQIIRSANYEVKPAIEALLKSAHFFDVANRGAMIKSPVDFLATVFRHFNVPWPTTQNELTLLNRTLSGALASLQMDLLNQPSVAGWPAYYQTPDFDKLWITSATLPLRNGNTDAWIYGGAGSLPRPMLLNSVAFVETRCPSPSDAKKLIEWLARDLFVAGLTTEQIDYVVNEIFLAGLPAYEWTEDWNTYKANSGNNQARTAVKTRLDALLRFMFRLAEFQLY